MTRIKFKKQVFEEASKVSHLTLQIGESTSLREKSQDVNISEISITRIKSVISKLKKTLKEYRRLTGKGRGIAAVQIGVPVRIAVVFIDNKILTIINPKATRRSNNKYLYPEICMSANPIIAKVVRPEFIEFEYYDDKGIKQFWNNKDRLLNRVIQHEIDHMEGIINIDLVESKDLILLSDPDFFENAEFIKV